MRDPYNPENAARLTKYRTEVLAEIQRRNERAERIDRMAVIVGFILVMLMLIAAGSQPPG